MEALVRSVILRPTMQLLRPITPESLLTAIPLHAEQCRAGSAGHSAQCSYILVGVAGVDGSLFRGVILRPTMQLVRPITPETPTSEPTSCSKHRHMNAPPRRHLSPPSGLFPRGAFLSTAASIHFLVFALHRFTAGCVLFLPLRTFAH